MPRRPSPSRRIIERFFLILVTLIAIIILWELRKRIPPEESHIVIAIIVLVVVGLFEHLFLQIRFEKWIRDDILMQVQEGDDKLGKQVAEVNNLLNSNHRSLESSLSSLRQQLDDSHKLINQALRQFEALLIPAASCGLTHIYPDRRAAEEDVMRAIEKAQRVSILGIAFSEAVSMTRLVDELSKKSENPGFELRILMLDPLRSPAIFRSFFEATPDDVDRTMKMGGAKGSDDHSYYADHPYFAHPLYNDFLISYNKIKYHQEFHLDVRFYAHNPSCWMLIIDGEAFFQPYTVGSHLPKSENALNNLRLGAFMPVFRFDKNKDRKVFELLEDHFNKLWLTTDIDMFHMQARLDDKREIVRDIFTRRMDWLKHVYTILHKIAGKERRTSPRQPCRTKTAKPLGFVVSWTHNGVSAEATIENFSREGLGVKLMTETCPSVGQELHLTVSPEPKTPGAEYIIARLFRQNNHQFEVMHVTKIPPSTTTRGERMMIGLRPSRVAREA